MTARALPLVLAALLADAAAADSVIATRTLRAGTLIGPGDVALAAGDHPGALRRPEAAIGLEARVALYAGRPVAAGDLGPPAIVERNQIVTLIYRQGLLTITAEGRSLGRGGAGDRLRVMNLASRTTVVGRIAEDGTLHVEGAGTTATNR